MDLPYPTVPVRDGLSACAIGAPPQAAGHNQVPVRDA